MSMRTIYQYMKFLILYIAMAASYETHAMDPLGQEEGYLLSNILPETLTVRTIVIPVYLSETDRKNVSVQSAWSEMVELRDNKSVKKSASFEPVKLYPPEKYSCQVKLLNLEYQGAFFLGEETVSMHLPTSSYTLSLQNNSVVYSHKFSGGKDSKKVSPSIFRNNSPVKRVEYIPEDLPYSVVDVHLYGGCYNPGFSLDQCEQMYYIINPIPYRFCSWREHEINIAYPYPTQFTLFSHSDWFKRGVSPFSPYKQYARNVLGKKVS